MSQVATNDPAVVEVAFVPTVDDQVRAMDEVTRPPPRRQWWVAVLVALLVINSIMQVRREGLRVLFGFAGLSLLIAAVGGLVSFRLNVLMRWGLARHARRHPAAYSPVMYTFNADGLRIESKLGTTELPWSSFTGARETTDQFLLPCANGQQYFVPRRAVRESDELRLRTLLQAHLGARAELMTPTDN
jgi:hypothetical protein